MAQLEGGGHRAVRTGGGLCPVLLGAAGSIVWSPLVQVTQLTQPALLCQILPAPLKQRRGTCGLRIPQLEGPTDRA